MLHEDVTADALQFSGHALAVGCQRIGHVARAVDGAHRTRSLWIADQANRLARNRHADADFRADRDEVEVFAQAAAAQA